MFNFCVRNKIEIKNIVMYLTISNYFILKYTNIMTIAEFVFIGALCCAMCLTLFVNADGLKNVNIERLVVGQSSFSKIMILENELLSSFSKITELQNELLQSLQLQNELRQSSFAKITKLENELRQSVQFENELRQSVQFENELRQSLQLENEDLKHKNTIKFVNQLFCGALGIFCGVLFSNEIIKKLTITQRSFVTFTKSAQNFWKAKKREFYRNLYELDNLRSVDNQMQSNEKELIRLREKILTNVDRDIQIFDELAKLRKYDKYCTDAEIKLIKLREKILTNVDNDIQIFDELAKLRKYGYLL